jgi:hypothetical protein
MTPPAEVPRVGTFLAQKGPSATAAKIAFKKIGESLDKSPGDRYGRSIR